MGDVERVHEGSDADEHIVDRLLVRPSLNVNG